MIQVENIQKSFGTLQVLKGINLHIEKGKVASIVGASGAGKTTLLHIMGTLDKPDQGQVLYNDTDVFTLGERKLNTFRNKHIGFVFQFHHLLPDFTALENVMMPALIAGTSGTRNGRAMSGRVRRSRMTLRQTRKNAPSVPHAKSVSRVNCVSRWMHKARKWFVKNALLVRHGKNVNHAHRVKSVNRAPRKSAKTKKY